jgi:hypothetical protein
MSPSPTTPSGVARLRLGEVSGLRRPFSRHCEERSDVAIRRTWYGIMDCHVATLLPVLPNLQFGSGEYKHLQCGKYGRGLLYIRYDDIAHCKCAYSSLPNCKFGRTETRSHHPVFATPTPSIHCEEAIIKIKPKVMTSSRSDSYMIHHLQSRRDDTLLTVCVSLRSVRLYLPKVPQGRHLKTGHRMIIKCRPCGTWQERAAGLSGS